MQALPDLIFTSEHNFDDDTVKLIASCRCVLLVEYDCNPTSAQRDSLTGTEGMECLTWFSDASPGDLRAIHEIGLQLHNDDPDVECDKRILIKDLFASVMASYAVKWMGNFGGDVASGCHAALLPLLLLLSKCAELGVVFAKLTLARMHFECTHDAVRQSLATYVSPAAALEYLLEAADVHNACEAHALLGTLHFQGSDCNRGAAAPVRAAEGRAESPFPYSVDKSIDHFKKAVESYDALAEPKQLVTGKVSMHILGAFSREGVLMTVCATATMYMNNPMGINRPFISQDPKRSRAVFKWAASKGFSPAVAILGGANPKCAHCGGNKPSNHCSGCMCTRYCSKECQRKHWGNHKGECLTIFHDEVLANFGECFVPSRRS